MEKKDIHGWKKYNFPWKVKIRPLKVSVRAWKPNRPWKIVHAKPWKNDLKLFKAMDIFHHVHGKNYVWT